VYTLSPRAPGPAPLAVLLPGPVRLQQGLIVHHIRAVREDVHLYAPSGLARGRDPAGGKGREGEGRGQQVRVRDQQ
jgi:hypothetical protein